jgi:3-phosphoshikimate 1-carboxyvinyltransferase
VTSSRTIQPIGVFHASVRPPGSKSLTNRALLLAALAQGRSTVADVLLSDDSRVMMQALRELGFAIDIDEPNRFVTVEGQGGRFPSTQATLMLGNAGTAYRFLTAACCLGEGQYTLDGVPRMRQRPIAPLVDALRTLGADIRYLDQAGFPPLQLTASGLRHSEQPVPIRGEISSQFISALLQVGPCVRGGMAVQFDGPVVSRPYIEMTLALMQRFGARFDVDSAFRSVRIQGTGYRGMDYDVEPDASNASYFLAAAAIVPGSKCTIEGLGRRSVQGDVGFADVLHQMGAGLFFGGDFITVIGPPADQPLRGIDIDLNAMPDMAQTLAVVALFARGQTAIRNIGNLRVKETDRLEALRVELTKLGARVSIDGDDLIIDPPAGNALRPAEIDTYDDHRMAMSFAVAGLRAPGVVIRDPACVNKTFPEFFEYLQGLDQVKSETRNPKSE